MYSTNFTHQIKNEVQYETRSIVLGEQHFRRILTTYLAYYHRSRTHLSLDKDAPESRDVQPSKQGKVGGVPRSGWSSSSVTNGGPLSPNTVHLMILMASLRLMGAMLSILRGRSGKLLIFLLTPRGLRRVRLETTRSSRISASTLS